MGIDQQTFEDERGLLLIRRVAPGVLLFVEKGYLVGARAPLIIEAKERELKFSQRLTLFVDAEQLQGYDPPIRTMPTDWIKKNAQKVAVQHMLVKSQIARMGLAVAGLALGTVIKGHTTRLDFDAALRAVTPRLVRQG
jgi:hypothetical protein